jgi:hypothetical protein
VIIMGIVRTNWAGSRPQPANPHPMHRRIHSVFARRNRVRTWETCNSEWAVQTLLRSAPEPR